MTTSAWLLIVDGDARRREALSRAAMARQLMPVAVPDAKKAIYELRRRELSGVVMTSRMDMRELRAVCLFARKTHPLAHVFVHLARAADEPDVRSAAGIEIAVIEPDAQPFQIATRAFMAVRKAPSKELLPPSTDVVLHALEALEQGSDGTRTNVDAAPSGAARGRMLWSGRLEADAFPLVMAIFAMQATGRLEVDEGAARGTLLFLAGEPVHALDPDGPRGTLDRLARRGLVPSGFDAGDRDKGEILAALARRAKEESRRIFDVLREEVEERVRVVLEKGAGPYRFVEDTQFLDDTILTNVSPFRLVVQVAARASGRDDLVALAGSLDRIFPNPSVWLRRIGHRLATIRGGPHIADAIDGRSSGAAVVEALGLDPLAGAALLRALERSGLVALADRPVESADDGEGLDGPSESFTLPIILPAAETQQSGWPAGAANSAADRLGSAYLELKALRRPEAILGLDATGDAPVEEEELDRAYLSRLRQLDPAAIPEGPERPLLLARAEELRQKVQWAYDTLVELRRGARHPSGSLTGRYELLGKVGTGGMANVFVARRKDSKRRDDLVAIKAVLPQLAEEEAFIAMFLDEARMAGRVNHPNVVRVLEHGRLDAGIAIVMEYVPGWDLETVLRKARARDVLAPVAIACRILAEACGGLHAAHTAKDAAGRPMPVIHRDVTPHNVLLSTTGAVKLTDFGIAKAGDRLAAETRSGAVKGKVTYLPPEHLDGRPANVRSDIYCASLVLYTMLTGIEPFKRETDVESLSAIRHSQAPPIRRFRPDVPNMLVEIVERGMARDPQMRFTSAQELQLHLEGFVAASGARASPADIAAFARSVADAPRAPLPADAPLAPSESTEIDVEVTPADPSAPP